MVNLLKLRIRVNLALLCGVLIGPGATQGRGAQIDPSKELRAQSASENEKTPASAQITAATPSPTKPAGSKRARLPLGPISKAKREGIFNLDVTVTDAAGKLVTDLEADDFTLLDNDQPTRIFTLQSFARAKDGTDPPPELIFVFDEVNLNGQQIEAAERAASDFLKQNGGRLVERVSLYRVKGEGLSGSVEPSMNGDALAEELEKKWEPRILWRVKLTSMNPILSTDYAQLRNGLSLKALGSIAIDQREVPGRKVVIWFGNGWPVDASGDFGWDEETEIATRLREARMTVNVVSAWPNPDRKFRYQDSLAGVESQKEMAPAKLTLQVVAIHTGGLVLDSSTDLKADVGRCAAEAEAYYKLTFDPAHTDQVDEYHDLEVRVTRPGLTARTVSSYYDEPAYFDRPRITEQMTVAQLEQLVGEAKGHSGSGALRRLSEVELTERLSREKLAALREYLHKEKERQALEAIADVSAFLPPPKDEIPTDPTPDRATQLAILQKALNYLSAMVPKLPDFVSTRRTVEYAEPPQLDNQTWKIAPSDQTLRAVRTTLGSVLYRHGEEVVETEGKARKPSPRRERSMEFRGTFGGTLESILFAASHNKTTVAWERWDPGDHETRGEMSVMNGSRAVFRFSTPRAAPAFEMSYCCTPEDKGTRMYKGMIGYHGEFEVDPATGAVLRLMMESNLDIDLEPKLPLMRSGLVVEYGPVEIGGKTYICPRRGVSLSRGRTVRELHEFDMEFVVYAPFETMVNDFRFAEYHKFGSESRMLTGFEEVPDEKAPASNGPQQPAKPR